MLWEDFRAATRRQPLTAADDRRNPQTERYLETDLKNQSPGPPQEPNTPLLDRIAKRTRILSLLVVTSMIGVLLILVAVYQAARDLEVVHDVDALHAVATAQLAARPLRLSDGERLRSLAALGHRALLIRGDDVLADTQAAGALGPRLTPAKLEASRVNHHGGQLNIDDESLIWTRVSTADKGVELVLLHGFRGSSFQTIRQVYTKRLLVPAAFYVWLMVWMGFIVNFLTGKLAQQKDEMAHLALHDPLTGLPNRNLLTDRLAKLLASSQRNRRRFAVVMIDLDGFKRINDTLGHEAGDTVLREIATRLIACLRSVDTVARVGGDEFVLLLEEVEPGSCIAVCTRVAAEISNAIAVGDGEVQVGSSIGVAVFPDDGATPQALLRDADAAMYAVKATGGGIRVCGA